MAIDQAKRNSVVSQVTAITDEGSSAFVTPLATPSELRGQFPSQLDLDDVERTPQKPIEDDDAVSELSGTITPKQEITGALVERPASLYETTREDSSMTTNAPAEAGKATTAGEAATLEQEHAPLQWRSSREFPLAGPGVTAMEKITEPQSAHGNAIEHEKELDSCQATAAEEVASSTNRRIAEGELTGTTVTTEHSEENIKPDSSGSKSLEGKRSFASLSAEDPTGFTTGIGTSVVAEEEKTLEEEGAIDLDDESRYPSGVQLTLITTGLALATFVVALDNTIIATAIPQITSVFNSLGDVGWYGSSYLLTTTSLQPTFGKIYTHFNIKWTYLIALVIFEVGSVLCAAAVNSTMLIIGRAVAGCGAAALFSGAMTIVAFTVPLRKRAFFIAMLSSMFGIASVVGPLLGGAFTDRLSWRWCFWINLPVGGVALATVFLFFKNPPREDSTLTFREKIAEMDILGAFFLICAIICLLLALQWGGTTYAWSDSKVWGCLLGFGLLILVFIGLQVWRGDRATIPPRIVKQRTVAAGCLFSLFLALALYAHIYYLPFYFQAVQGTSAEGSGIRTIPYLVSNTIAAIIVGASITKLGYYNPGLFFGSAVFTVGAGLLYTLQVGDYPGKWIGYQLLAGIGSGACIQVPFISVQVALPPKDMPTGNAITIFSNTLGGALSVSIAQNIFSNFLLQQLEAKAPMAPIALIIQAGATHVREVTPPQLLEPVLEAYNAGITRAFILPIAVGGIAFICSFFFEWKSLKGKRLELGGGA